MVGSRANPVTSEGRFGCSESSDCLPRSSRGNGDQAVRPGHRPVLDGSDLEGTVDRRAQWVAAWRSGVQASSTAVVLVDLASTRYAAASPAGAGLLGTLPVDMEGLSYLQVAERPAETALIFDLARAGLIDGFRASRQYRRSDGTPVSLRGYASIIRSWPGADLAIWAADELPSTGGDGAELSPRVATGSPGVAGDALVAEVSLSADWRIGHIAGDTAPLMGRPGSDLIGTALIELVHPDDVALLLFAFARATVEPGATVSVRLRHDQGGWQLAWLQVTLEVIGGARRFALRVGGGEARLPAWWADVANLTARQREVVSRLLDGQRVASMASAMYVSPSTIRNHLAEIFRKTGVHSQNDLIRLLRQSPPAASRVLTLADPSGV